MPPTSSDRPICVSVKAEAQQSLAANDYRRRSNHAAQTLAPPSALSNRSEGKSNGLDAVPQQKQAGSNAGSTTGNEVNSPRADAAMEVKAEPRARGAVAPVVEEDGREVLVELRNVAKSFGSK